MKYTIICDQPQRLRIRLGKYIITKEQSYGLTDLLLSYDGISDVVINERNGSILVIYRGKNTRDQVLKLIKDLKTSEIEDGTPCEEQKVKILEQEFRKKLLIHVGKHYATRLILPMKWRNILTCYSSIPFIVRGIKVLFSGKIGIEVLDATAILTSILSKAHQTASSTMFLLGLSELLLEYSNARAKNALAQSLVMSVHSVWIVKDGQEIEIEMSDLRVRDIIRIRKGTMIPIDGVVVNGEAMVNEATMTGEAIPVLKSASASVFAGTIVEEGELDIEVYSLQNDSRISNIIQMIETGEDEKANIHGKAERIADEVVPLSFGLFFTTLLLTGNYQRALSVLMVDFSCGIKLTTPIAILTALKECASWDVVVKGGKYLEVLAQVDTVVFDKTGTLTNAIPKVSKIIPLHKDYSEEKVLRIAACLEEHFPHSVATSIVEEARKRRIIHPEDHGKVEYIVAHGVASNYNGKRAVIGSKHFIFDDELVPYPKEMEEWITAEIGSSSAVYLAIDNELIGIVCVDDPPRIDAVSTIEGLREVGIDDIIMITGDSERSAKYTCELIGIERYYAGVLPEEKANIIEKLRSEGKVVLMVGDGINDTPALSMADVSLTLNGSSDIAREIADISILSDELEKIITTRKISQNLLNKLNGQYKFIAYFNTILIALGMAGVLKPRSSAIMHNASTMGVAVLSTRPVLKDK